MRAPAVQEFVMLNDPSYYTARAAEERRLAMASDSSNIRRIHLDMAARYDALAGPKIIDSVPTEARKRTA